MHLIIVITAIGLGWYLRWQWSRPTGSWTQRWQRALLHFLLPPLLLFMTAIAVLGMGPKGQMLGLEAGWLSYILALGFVGFAGISVLRLAYQGWCSLQEIRTYARQSVAGKTARILDTNFPYSALVGFWQPELAITQGLFHTLDSAHLQAVLAHEQAHYDCHDTFWFFWLGWLRSCTAWFPNTEVLWQELLLLRELRADYKAARQVDALLLAEALLEVARAPIQSPESFYAPFSCAAPASRLQERIDALLNEPESPPASPTWVWSWMLLAFLPLMTMPFHN